MASSRTLWPFFAKQVVPRLTPQDDPDLWRAVIDRVLGDADDFCRESAGKVNIVAQIGCCSHWLAPNKARWITADGEFAWPSGYQPKLGFFGGLPEFDWSLHWECDTREQIWRHIDNIRRKRPLFLRVAIPARTALRHRASILAFWSSGPRRDWNPARLFYGFRKTHSVWHCRAYRGAGGKRRART